MERCLYHSFKIKNYLSCSLGASIILAEIYILQNIEMKVISITVTVRSAVLCMDTMGSCAVAPRANEPHTNLCMLYTASPRFLCRLTALIILL